MIRVFGTTDKAITRDADGGYVITQIPTAYVEE